MNIFKKFYKTIAPEITRFPLIVFTSIVAFVFWSIFQFVEDDVSKLIQRISYSAVFTLFCSIFIAFLFEYIFDKKLEDKKIRIKSLLIQFFILIVSYVLSFGFYVENSPFYKLGYWGLIFVFVVLTAFCLIKFYKVHELLCNADFSYIYAGLLSTCFCGGVCLLIWAVSNLLFKIDEQWYMVCLFFSYIVVFINYFIANIIDSTKTEKEHKVHKVIVKNVLFTIYIVLISVLYLFLLKSLLSFKMPVGKINWFVSFATAYYFVFNIYLKCYDDEKYIKFFYKYGFLFLIPLIVLQIIVYIIQVNAYGFTMARYASLLYIIFSIIGIFICVFKSGKFLKYIFVVFAFFILIGTIGPLNIIQVPLKDQIARIENIYKKYNLYSNEDLNNPQAKSIITKSDQEKIYQSFLYIIGDYKKSQDNKFYPAWYKKYESKYENFKWHESFKECFGYDLQNTVLRFSNEADFKSFDVKHFSKIVQVDKAWIEKESSKIYVQDFDENTYDITEDVSKIMLNAQKEEGENAEQSTSSKNELIIIDLKKGKKLVVTRLSVRMEPHSEFSGDNYCNIDGFIAVP